MEAVRPFSDIRIIDLTFELGRYCTRLFADLGAEVIKIEPKEGARDRKSDNQDDFTFAFFNASKKSVVLSPEETSDQARFEELAGSAQIIVVERGNGFCEDIAQLRKLAPSAVITVISAFGLGGPLEDAPSNDLVLQAAGGILWMSGRIDDAPLRLPVHQSVFVTSVYAAAATAIALFDTENTGQGHLIDVSAQECIAHSLQNAIQVWDLEQRVSLRGGEGTRDASEDIFPCKDGHMFLASPPTLGASWKSLVAWMMEINHPAGQEFKLERWLDREWRLTGEARTIFRNTFETFSRDFTKQELVDAAITRKIVMGPVNKVSDLFKDEQLEWRGFFQKLDVSADKSVLFPGPPYRLSEDVWRVTPAPTLSQHAVVLKEMRKAR